MHSVQCALKVEAQYYNNSKCLNVLFLFCSPVAVLHQPAVGPFQKTLILGSLILKAKKCDFFQNCIFFSYYPSIMWWNENATHNLLLNKIFIFELRKCCYFNSRYTIHEYYIKYVGDYFFISKKILFIRKICKYLHVLILLFFPSKASRELYILLMLRWSK